MAGAKINLDNDLFVASICEKMKWTYNEYMDQPTFFIKTLLLKFNIDIKEDERQLRQIKHASK